MLKQPRRGTGITGSIGGATDTDGKYGTGGASLRWTRTLLVLFVDVVVVFRLHGYHNGARQGTVVAFSLLAALSRSICSFSFFYFICGFFLCEIDGRVRLSRIEKFPLLCCCVKVAAFETRTTRHAEKYPFAIMTVQSDEVSTFIRQINCQIIRMKIFECKQIESVHKFSCGSVVSGIIQCRLVPYIDRINHCVFSPRCTKAMVMLLSRKK